MRYAYHTCVMHMLIHGYGAMQIRTWTPTYIDNACSCIAQMLLNIGHGSRSIQHEGGACITFQPQRRLVCCGEWHIHRICAQSWI